MCLCFRNVQDKLFYTVSVDRKQLTFNQNSKLLLRGNCYIQATGRATAKNFSPHDHQTTPCWSRTTA